MWRGRGGRSQWARAERRAGVSGPAVAAGTRDHGVARTLDRVARTLDRVARSLPRVPGGGVPALWPVGEGGAWSARCSGVRPLVRSERAGGSRDLDAEPRGIGLGVRARQLA